MYNAAPTSDERTFAVLAHILALVPGVGILGPLIIYLAKANDSAFIRHHAKESLNFQITIILAYFVAALLVLFLIGFALLWLVGILNTIFVIVATIKTLDNSLYQYPFSIRLVR